MNKNSPLFGFIAGIATTLVFLPHVAFMLVLLLLQRQGVAFHLLLFTFLTRVLGDWFFWGRLFPSRMDAMENTSNWRYSVREGFCCVNELQAA